MSNKTVDEETGWHLKYRPRRWEDIIGQDDAVKSLRGYGDRVPHAILATGQTGGGKTTALRILADQLGCPEDAAWDRIEMNCAAVESPLAEVQKMTDRRLTQTIGEARVRVYILDEVQAWVRSRGAQEALLKLLEDVPPHVYYFLATTDPAKIIKPIHTRCAKITFKPVPNAALKALLDRVCRAEGVAFDPHVAAALVESAAGSPRSLLVEAQRVAGLDPRDRLASVTGGATETAAFELVKALAPFKGQPDWVAVSRVLTALKDDGHEPEKLRRLVLACAGGQLLKAGGGAVEYLRYKILSCLGDPYYDEPTAWWFLARDCFKVVYGGK